MVLVLLGTSSLSDKEFTDMEPMLLEEQPAPLMHVLTVRFVGEIPPPLLLPLLFVVEEEELDEEGALPPDC